MDVHGRGRSGYETTSELDFSSRYYNATIIQMAGIQSDQVAIWLAAVVAFNNFMFSIVGVWLVERVGRRKLLLGSLAGVTLFLFLIGGAFYSAQQHDIPISLREETPLGISNNCPTSGHCLDCLQAKCGFCFGEDDARNYVNGSCIPKNRTTSELLLLLEDAVKMITKKRHRLSQDVPTSMAGKPSCSLRYIMHPSNPVWDQCHGR